MEKYYGKKIDMERLKAKVNRAADVAKFKKYCQEILKNSDPKDVDCFVCGNRGGEFVLNIFGFDYVRCPKCSHVYVSKLPDFEKIQESYATDIFDEMTLKHYADKDVYQYRVENIAKPKVEFVEKFANKGKWLDIGCGTGEVLHYAQKQGWDVLGLEVNKIARDFARETLGVAVENKLAEDLPWETMKSFDVISMFGVLEHLTKPREIIKTISENSKKDVSLVIGVPNFDSFSSLCQIHFRDNINRHFVPFAHISFFTLDSLKKILGDFGFEIVVVWHFGQDFYEFLENLLTYDPKLRDTEMFKFLLNSFNDFQYAIDRQGKGDEMLVVAKKQ